jgi:hypothetical protein
VHLIAALAILAGGLHGTVTKGPTMPVCRQGQPCSAPAQVTLLFRRAGRTTRVRTTSTGVYRIRLAAGYYTVSTVERIGITPNIRPQRVHVRAGHDDRLDFSIDTGIR